MIALPPNLAQAAAFLRLLDPDAERFTFQTATDAEPKPQPDHRAKILDLPPSNLEALATRNRNGAAVWVCINETDGRGRKRENVIRVRAVFLDGDGQVTLDQLLSFALEPHIVVETSPGHYQAYWLVEDLLPEQFESVQRSIAKTFGDADSIVDLCRPMRVPGFCHQKDPARPFQVRIAHENVRLPYDVSEILAEFGPVTAATQPGANGHEYGGGLDLDDLRKALTGETPNGWHIAMLRAVGRMVATGAEDWFIRDWALQYRWPGYTEQQTLADVQGMIDRARAKGFAPIGNLAHGATVAAALLGGAQQDKAEADGRKQPQFPCFQTGEEFIAGYQAKRLLLKELNMKPGHLYSWTAVTGGAKTAIALALSVQLGLEGKKIVYLAGENPDDVRERVILMLAKLGKQLPPTLRFVAETFDLHKGFEHVRREVEAMDGADLIFVDTSPAFQSASGGKEENSNNEQIAWARHLRKLTRLEGNPTVVAECHPTKYPLTAADCLPRGGGAFLNEVDGNYTSWHIGDDGDDRIFEVSYAGKFRGRFAPITYKTEYATCDDLRDEDGNPVFTVWARRAEETELARASADQAEDEDAVLVAMNNYPGKSFAFWAEQLGWRMPSGPAKYRVERVVKRLEADKYAKKDRGHYELTPKGKKAARAAEETFKGTAPTADFSALLAKMRGAK